ncbi:Uncharacterized protein TCM_045344 [Theobroma cacao]|uniref:Uncharacterized protein n=1 Tax=Theobroma cacao TaxID=3641 RepID=A0A061FYQ3_THECC|nr:Uncharacterized protein TCM_045344 [Theobroma cacao]
MATEDRDIHQTLGQLNQTLSVIDQNLDQVSQDSSTEVLNGLAEAVAGLKANQEELKDVFYELLTPFFQPGEGNSHNRDLSQLQDEGLRVIETEGEDELVGLVDGLEGLKKRGDELNERVIELMRDYNVVPKCSGGIEESYKENKPMDLESLAFTKEDGQEESQGPKRNLESRDFSFYVVATHLYGFPWNVAMEIKRSLGHRTLVESERLFLEDEDHIVLDEDSDSDDDGKLQEKDAGELKWVRVKKLKQIFEELKKKIYIKEEIDLNVSPKASDSGDELDPVNVNLRIRFLKVIRNWIFHIESVFVDLMFEIYYMFPGNDAEENIFQDLKSKLEDMMEIYLGMVPISVYKIIYMMENTEGANLEALMKMMTTLLGSNEEILYEKMNLNDRMDQAHKIILRLSSMLVTADLSYTRFIKEGESATNEKLLSESEEELRDIQRNIDRVKSELKIK